MAVQLAGVRNGLIGLGFTQAAATAIVIEQGYDSLTAISELTDLTIVDLVATVRKPGGTILNPGAGPPTIPNPGTNIGHRAATNLKLGTFVARHYLRRTSRPMDNPVQLLNTNNIQNFLGLKHAEDAYTEPIAVPILERIEKNRDHIENIDSHLLKTLGMAKTPLAYVVRTDIAVPPSPHALPNNYGTIQEEMVARMPHNHLAYREDNINFWEVI
jgi:hypothetical protein